MVEGVIFEEGCMYLFGIFILILLLIMDLCILLCYCVIIVVLLRILKNYREGEGGRDFCVLIFYWNIGVWNWGGGVVLFV